jgi:molecular chaperone DnaJ
VTEGQRHAAGEGDDLYATLGVPKNASDEEITTAYRRLARQHHPDANPEAGADAFAGLTDAYDVLRDPQRRRTYDDTRRARTRAADAATGVRIPVHHATPGRARRRTGGPDAAHEPAPSDEIELALTFDQAALGTTAVVHVGAELPCSSCGGSGASVSGPPACPVCHGTGATARTSGGITIRAQCPRCQGAKWFPAACSRCGGIGTESADRGITVRVPPGVEDGTRLRVPLPGGDGRPLFALVRTAPHPYFGRRGHDLTLRLPITLAEAALGSVVTVPTLAGAVAIRIPPGSTHGRVLRVRGHGISRGTEAGDLLVTVAIVVPASVNDAQRAALEAFAAATESPRTHLEGPVGDDRRQ